ncbi:MAG: chromate efflux transporter [Hyphomicrobiaceae bacterium]
MTVPAPTFAQAIRQWTRIGLLSFGGPAAQIALMHRVLVEEKRWLDEPRFLSALNFCMLLPGPEAMQLATYAGWRLHGLAGGLAAGLLFVVPGALVMLALTILYALYGAVPLVTAIFVGIKAAVLAIVVEALLRVARKALKGSRDWAIAAAAFIGIFALGVPFPIIVVAAGLAGYLGARLMDAQAMPQSTVAVAAATARAPTLGGTLGTALAWLAVWWLPIGALALVLGPQHVLVEIGWFFSKLAVVTFGGAYAVLAYMAQEVVSAYRWLSPGEMLDALGLAETTPGPLILVTEFVGGLAAGRDGGGLSLGMLAAGALVTLWVTFVPCFLWIFVGAPYVERINDAPRLRSALRGVTAAVVGVILNLSVWFAIHVLFARVASWKLGWLALPLPELASLVPLAAVLTVVAMVLIFVLHRGVATTLAICAGLAWLASWAGLSGGVA